MLLSFLILHTFINFFSSNLLYFKLKVINKKKEYGKQGCNKDYKTNYNVNAYSSKLIDGLLDMVSSIKSIDISYPENKLNVCHKLYRDSGYLGKNLSFERSKIDDINFENSILSLPFCTKPITTNYVHHNKNVERNKLKKYKPISFLNCVYTNATSLNLDKITELTVLTNTLNPDIILITETWFTSSSNSYLPNYITYRRDRESHAGGIAIIIKNDLISAECTFFKSEYSEQLWVTVTIEDEIILVGCIYRPPSAPSDPKIDREINYNIIKASQMVQNNTYSGIVIGGDFNYPEIHWDEDNCATVLRQSECPATLFMEAFFNSSLTQNINFPTFIKSDGSSFNTLDYIITDTPERVSTLKTLPPLGVADQGHIIITWKFHLTLTHKRSLYSLSRYKFAKGDYTNLNNFYNEQDWFKILNNDSIKSCYDNFLSLVHSGYDKFIPKGSKSQKEKSPWITPEVVKLAKKKYSLFMKNVSSNWKIPSLVYSYKKARSDIKKLSSRNLSDYELGIAMDKNPRKKIYKYVNCRKKVQHKINSICRSDGSITNNNHEIACTLNSQFNSVFVDDSQDDLPSFALRTNEILSTVDFSYNDVFKILTSLDPNKSQGTDQVHPHVLVKCADSLSYPIFLILKASFITGTTPPEWVEANVNQYSRKVTD